MAGAGSNFVLDKGFSVLSTYNSSNAAGVTPYRCVAFSGTAGQIDLNASATTRTVGIVMEGIDRTKVATGKAMVDVRMAGIAPVIVTTAASIVLGGLVMPSTGGGVIAAVTATNMAIGMVVGITGTLAAGDIIQVFLVPQWAA